MERAVRVAETVLAGRELAEVAGGLGDDVVIELEDDAARGLAADGNIELELYKLTVALAKIGHGRGGNTRRKNG